MKHYPYMFFDLDGTLVQSEFGIFESANYALVQMGREPRDNAFLKKIIGPPLFYSFHTFFDMTEEDAEQAVKHYRDHYTRIGVYKSPLFEGVKETLEAIKNAGSTLLVVTGKPTALAKTVLSENKIDIFFSEVIGPDPKEKTPTKEGLIKRAMATQNLTDDNLSEIIMVGDRCFDIEGAVKVGIDSAGVLYGYGNREEFEEAGATYIIKKLNELCKF